jgi:hypothetical protein
LNFVQRFLKIPQIKNLMKIHSVGAYLFDKDRQADGYEEANSQFSQLCESPDIIQFVL